MSSNSSQKIIINNEYNLSKIKSIIKSKNPEVLILESGKASLNLKTKRKRDNCGLLKITLINHKFIGKYMGRK